MRNGTFHSSAAEGLRVRMGCLLCVLGLAAPIFEALASTTEFDRYQVILDRKPFGQPPIAAEPPPPPPGPATPPWAESYRLVSVTKVEGGDIRVGILDRRSNKALVLRVGEMQEGIELLDASVDDESAQLRKDGETVTMNLQDARGSAPIAPPGQPPPGVRPTVRPGATPPPRPALPTPPGARPAPAGILRPGATPAPSPE